MCGLERTQLWWYSLALAVIFLLGIGRGLGSVVGEAGACNCSELSWIMYSGLSVLLPKGMIGD